MARFTLTQNGTEITRHDTRKAVEEHMASTLSEYKYLEPREIYRGCGCDNRAGFESMHGKIKRVIIFQYRTGYTEIFMIEEDE